MKVLVADDEQMARARMVRLLRALPDVEVVGEAVDGEDVLRQVRAGGIDVVLLDVQMPRLSGDEAMAAWPVDGPLVIFCTAHAEYAVKAYDVGALDYVVKPVEAERLAKAIDRARTAERRQAFSTVVQAHQLARIPVTTRHGVLLVDPAGVTHATLDGALVTLFTRDGPILTDFTLNDVEQRLPPGRFERVHRRAVVNLEAVTRLEPLETGGYLAHLPGGHSVEVPRQAARDLRKRFGLRKRADEP